MEMQDGSEPAVKALFLVYISHIQLYILVVGLLQQRVQSLFLTNLKIKYNPYLSHWTFVALVVVGGWLAHLSWTFDDASCSRQL